MPSEIKALKLLVNILIIYQATSALTVKLVKTKNEALDFLAKEKFALVQKITNMIVTMDSGAIADGNQKVNFMKLQFKKIQKIKVNFSSASNFG